MKHALVIIAWLYAANVLAGSNLGVPDDVLSRASDLSLSRNRVWLKLLAYENPGTLGTREQSAVLNKDFFLSPRGKFDPAAELVATLKAIYLPATEVPDSHAQCRFRARYIWLKSKLHFSGEPAVTCKDYLDWSSGDSIKSVSVVLATGYLGNPASYYGHLLLKLNPADQSLHTNLQDESVNFGAIVPDNTNPVSYIANGIFGGYDGGFSHIQYYFHTHNYGENELRDLWEYELDLTPGEVRLLTAHAWEMLGRRFHYYFFHKNCAYRMGDMIELIDGIKLVPENPVYTIPQTIVQNIARRSHHGHPLLKSVTYYPSRQARMYRRFTALNATEQAIVRDAVTDTGVVDTTRFSELPVPDKQHILDTLMDYFEFANQERASFKTQNDPRYKKILARRYALPPGRPGASSDIPPSPATGRPPSQLRLGWLHNSLHGTGLSLVLRPAYYDPLDTGAGHVRDARLTMGEIHASVFPDRVVMNSLKLMSVESVNAADTGLPGDRGRAWRIEIGGEQQNLACTGCLVARAQGDYGITHAFNSSFLAGLYLGGAVQNNRNGNGPAFGRITLFSNIRLPGIRLRLSIESRKHFFSKLGNEVVWKAAARHPLGNRHAIRLTMRSNVAREVRLEYSVYW